MSQSPILYSPKEAAKILSISRSHLYNFLSDDQLGSFHIGRSRRISEDHMNEFISRRDKVAWPMETKRQCADNKALPKSSKRVLGEKLPVNNIISTQQFKDIYGAR